MKHVILCFLAGAVGLSSGWAGPVITSQPQSQEVVIGSETVFSVGAEGGAGMTYQWLFNGESIEDETSSAFTLEELTLGDSGSYQVRLTNDSGQSTLSRVARLSVYETGAPLVHADNRVLITDVESRRGRPVLDLDCQFIRGCHDPLHHRRV